MSKNQPHRDAVLGRRLHNRRSLGSAGGHEVSLTSARTRSRPLLQRHQTVSLLAAVLVGLAGIGGGVSPAWAATPPTLTGPLQLSGVAGESFEAGYSYDISGDPLPTVTLSADAPAGLSVQVTQNPETPTLGTAVVAGTTPGAAGEYPFTMTADNGVDPAAHLDVVLTAGTSPSVSGNPPAATINTPYSHPFTREGFPTPTVSLDTESGALPAGLSINTAGLLAGTPTESGTFPFTLISGNFTGYTPNSFTIVVQDPPTLSGPTRLQATVDAALDPGYSYNISGDPLPTVTLSADAPAGLSVQVTQNPETPTLGTAVVAGTTPGLAGEYPFTITADNGVDPAAHL
jgi:hypothetical protein